VDCHINEIYKIKCPTNKNDFTILSLNAGSGAVYRLDVYVPVMFHYDMWQGWMTLGEEVGVGYLVSVAF